MLSRAVQSTFRLKRLSEAYFFAFFFLPIYSFNDFFSSFQMLFVLQKSFIQRIDVREKKKYGNKTFARLVDLTPGNTMSLIIAFRLFILFLVSRAFVLRPRWCRIHNIQKSIVRRRTADGFGIVDLPRSPLQPNPINWPPRNLPLTRQQQPPLGHMVSTFLAGNKTISSVSSVYFMRHRRQTASGPDDSYLSTASSHVVGISRLSA